MSGSSDSVCDVTPAPAAVGGENTGKSEVEVECGVEMSQNQQRKSESMSVNQKMEEETKLETQTAETTGNLASLKLSEETEESCDSNVESSGGVEENNEAEAEKNAALLKYKLQTISTYMNLAANTKTHSLLLQDTTISGFLVLCLGDEDPGVIERSVQVFSCLSTYPENRPVLQTLNYFLKGLQCVIDNSNVTEATRMSAEKLFNYLKCQDHVPRPLTELSDSTKNSMPSQKDANIASTVVDGSAPTSVPKQVDLNTTMSTMKRKHKGRETVLYIDNEILQQKVERTKITQALIKVPGIISVTYDLKKRFCVIRGKRTVPPEDFGRAVAVLNVANVYLVRKNENKEEVKILMRADSNSDQENLPFPQYPEEAENEDADESRSLAKKEKRAEDTSLFKSAKSFIKRSFYW